MRVRTCTGSRGERRGIDEIVLAVVEQTDTWCEEVRRRDVKGAWARRAVGGGYEPIVERPAAVAAVPCEGESESACGVGKTSECVLWQRPEARVAIGTWSTRSDLAPDPFARSGPLVWPCLAPGAYCDALRRVALHAPYSPSLAGCVTRGLEALRIDMRGANELPSCHWPTDIAVISPTGLPKSSHEKLFRQDMSDSIV